MGIAFGMRFVIRAVGQICIYPKLNSCLSYGTNGNLLFVFSPSGFPIPASGKRKSAKES